MSVGLAGRPPASRHNLPANMRAAGTLSVFRKSLKTYCYEVFALKYLFSVIHVLISVYVLD